MTNPNLTQLLVVLDRSGSMATCKDDMENGLNEYFRTQAKLDGECRVDFVQFDTQYELVYTDTPVADAKAVLEPRGMTALLDAIGKSVTDLGQKLAAQEEDDRPGTVIVVVVTDGHENSSREWTAETVKELIARQENDYNWNFTFLGANMDAVAVGSSFGFSGGTSLTFDTNNIGATVASLGTYTTAVRGGASYSYTDEDREAQKA